MKKIFLSMLFLIISGLALFAQDSIVVSGMVTNDSLGTGIPGYPVYFASGNIQQGKVFTNLEGFYRFSIPDMPEVNELHVFTFDCYQLEHDTVLMISPGGQHQFEINFNICSGINPPPPSGCQANFYYVPDSSYNLLTYQFVDISQNMNIASWYWEFGDGTTSNEQNPMHTFTGTGMYNVCLTITAGVPGSPDFCESTFCLPVQIMAPGNCHADFYYVIDSLADSSALVHFQDLSIGNTSSWSWDFGDGTYSNEQYPDHYYPAVGYYNVCLTISDSSNLCYDTHCMEVFTGNHHGNCHAEFRYVNNSINDPYAFTFLDLSTGNITNWYWDFGDGTTSNEQNPVHYYLVGGEYDVCLTVSNADSSNLCYNTWCMNVFAGDSIVNCHAEFRYVNDSINDPYAFTFLDLSTGNITNWYWDFGDGTTSNEQNPVHYYLAGGEYDVCLTVSNADSSNLCYNTWCMNVFAGDSIVNCHAEFRYVNDSINDPYTFTFLDLSTGNITNWYWDFGDGYTSTEQNPVHTYEQSGIYVTCLTVSDSDSLNNCNDTECLEVWVNLMGGCQANFMYMPDSSFNSLTYHFFDMSFGNIDYWMWNFGDGSYSEEQNPVHIFPAAGTYNVSLAISGGNPGTNTFCSDTISMDVSVQTTFPCQAIFTYYADSIASMQNIYFNDQSIGNITSWNWNFDDGQTSSVQNPLHIYSQSGIYNVCLTITSVNNVNGDTCTNTFCQEIWVGYPAFSNIGGQVFAGDFPIDHGAAYLYQIDNEGAVISVSSMMIDTLGYYWFYQIPAGRYIVKAEVVPNSPLVGEFAPTYYENSLSWEQTTIIELTGNTFNADIHLIPVMHSSGNGTISGTISWVGLFKDYKVTEIVSGIEILLLDSENNLVEFTTTDENGMFSFENLALGTYILKGEYTGYYSNSQTVILSVNNSLQGNLEVLLSEHPTFGIEEVPNLTVNSVYPNPATDIVYLNINLEKSSLLEFLVYNMYGQMVYSNTDNLSGGNHLVSIPVSKFANGVYMITIASSGGKTVYSGKFTK